MTWRAKTAMLGYTCFILLMVLAAGVKIASSTIHDYESNPASHLNSTFATPDATTCKSGEVDLDINEPELFDDIPLSPLTSSRFSTTLELSLT